MRVYKVKNCSPKEPIYKIVEVEVERLEYPLKDSEEDTIHPNTHFTTKEEAYNKAISLCDSAIECLARDLKHYQKKIEKLKSLIARYAIAKNSLIDKKCWSL